jgi:phytoene dehydrogenase-like protein
VALNGALALGLYRHGCFYPEGGVGAIAVDLVASVRRDGGDVHYRAAVTSVRREGDAWRVTTAGGDCLLARQVVLNVPPWGVPDLLGADCPQALRERVRRLPNGWGTVVLQAVVEATAPAMRAPSHVQVVAEYDRSLAETNSCFVSLLPGEGRATGRLALAVSTHTRVDGWEGLDQPAYEERRATYRERLLAAAERALPGISAHLLHVDCATPRTYARFTQRSLGMVGGLPQTPALANFRALSHRAGAPGLYLVGDGVFPGAGTIGVTLGGLNAYRDVRQSAERRLPRVRLAPPAARASAQSTTPTPEDLSCTSV